MLIPVRCTSCRCSIGHVATLFSTLRKERVAAECRRLGLAPGTAAAKLDINVEDVLDGLKIERLCCRMHLMDSMEFRDQM